MLNAENMEMVKWRWERLTDLGRGIANEAIANEPLVKQGVEWSTKTYTFHS
jgi:hypothetical protein